MKFNIPYNNFSSGEWSPKMLARTDTDQYPHALTEMTNFMSQIQGGTFRRPGTKYISNAPGAINLAFPHRTFPYVSSSGTSYVLIMGRTTSSHASAPIWKMYNQSSGLYENVDFQAGITIEAYSTLHYVQVGDLMFFSNNGNVPFSLRPPLFAGDGGDWQVNEWWASTTVEVPVPFSYWNIFPYDDVQVSGLGGTITVTGTFTAGGAVTLSSSQSMFSNADAQNASFSPRMLIKVTSGGSTGVIKITTVTNSTTAAGSVVQDLPGASPATYGAAAGTSFQLSAWRGTTGFPKTVTAFQGRLYWAATSKFPDTFWASRIGNIWDMNEVPLAQDPAFTGGAFLEDNSRPFSLSPNTPEASNIVAMTSAKTLVMNTDRSEIVAYGTQGALGPNDFQFESSSSYGGSTVQPLRINNFLTFVQRGARKIRDFTFDWNESQYKSSDIGFVSDHLTLGTGGVSELSRAEINSSILFARTADNKLIYATLDRDYSINAWGRLRLGGTFSSGNVEILSVAAVPRGPLDAEDFLYVTVKRTISSITLIYFERLSIPYEEDTFDETDGNSEDNHPHYVDSWVSATSGSPQTVWNNVAGHLAGETVQVIGDGLFMGEFMVSTAVNNPITLPTAVSNILVGLKYTSRLETVPVEQGSQTGSAVGRPKRITELYFRFFNTYGAKYGTNRDTTLKDVVFNRGSTPMNEAVPFFTGDIDMKNTLGLDKTYTFIVESDYPFPCNVLAVGMGGVTYD